MVRDRKTHRAILYIDIRAVLASFELGLRFGYSAVVLMARGAQNKLDSAVSNQVSFHRTVDNVSRHHIP